MAGILTSDTDSFVPSPITLGSTPRDLQLSGLQMDRVEQVHSRAWEEIGKLPYHVNSASIVTECEAACAQLSREVYQTKQDVPVQHMITLVAGMSGVRAHYPTEQLVEDYKNAIERFRDLTKMFNEPSEGPDQSKLISAQRYQSALNINWKKSKFFTTANGSIGIGPDSILPGDAIFIVFTAHTPYILRQYPNSESYQFHGPAYVHGAMDGEAFAARNPIENYRSFLVS